MRALIAALALLAAPAAAQTAADLHAAERERFGYGELRAGADGNNPDALNAANYDEAEVGDLPLPPLFTADAQRTPAGWPIRRAELARLVEDNWTGRIPENVASFRLVWRKEVVARSSDRTVEQWIGQVVAPDGAMGPTVDATITFPPGKGHAPALISYSYIWPGGRVPDFGGAPPPDAVSQALRHGFAYVEYRPQLLQPDTAATMADGIIGLARWPRAEHDWGALRAWAWGASRLREELAHDPRIAAKHISLTGHSRFGKAVLVAAAFDPQFADAHVSSSGAGGAKIMRRDFGERWENLVGSGEFHWLTPAAMRYAQAGHSVAELPVDAHMLIALRAPHPLLVTSGRADKGDAWVDPRGMWLATMAARPAWALYGSGTPDGAMPPPLGSADEDFPLGWYQHDQGHVPWPAYEAFYRHEARFAGTGR
ncbi:glucuronyl esterase domain-containing protein [Croceibacterium aestuarii]|uniref:glucuronyl esterase domain-containing protein n=1 Tax=Croceibacterium aestuarii TaxID=3064139 RepID=UPI00272E0006|nr:hypothetical protein [Croceibacterium sp. D39]